MTKFDANGKLLRRKGTNFFTKLDVFSTNFADHKVKWDFTSHGIFIMVESGNQNDVIEYSMDGNDVHGDMSPRLPSEAIIFDNRYLNTIWFRQESSGPPIRVRIEVWRNDS